MAVLQPGCLLADLAVGDGALCLDRLFNLVLEKLKKTLCFPQRRPGRGGRGVKREVKLSQCFLLTCEVPEANSGCHSASH